MSIENNLLTRLHSSGVLLLRSENKKVATRIILANTKIQLADTKVNNPRNLRNPPNPRFRQFRKIEIDKPA